MTTKNQVGIILGLAIIFSAVSYVIGFKNGEIYVFKQGQIITPRESAIEGTLEWSSSLSNYGDNNNNEYTMVLLFTDFDRTRVEDPKYTYKENAYIVDRYPQSTKIKKIATIELPGMVGLGREVYVVDDKYFLYNTGLDYTIFTREGDIITDSVRKNNPEIDYWLIGLSSERIRENPFKVTIGGEGAGTVGEAMLDASTGKIVRGTLKIDEKW